MGHGAGGAQSSRGCIGVEVGLAGQVCGGQVRVNVACMRGAVVMERVWGLSGDVGGDVGLLAPMSSIPLGYHVLLGLDKDIIKEIQNESPTILVGKRSVTFIATMANAQHLNNLMFHTHYEHHTWLRLRGCCWRGCGPERCCR